MNSKYVSIIYSFMYSINFNFILFLTLPGMYCKQQQWFFMPEDGKRAGSMMMGTEEWGKKSGGDRRGGLQVITSKG